MDSITQAALIDEIIGIYNTGRPADVPAAQHILSFPSVQSAFAAHRRTTHAQGMIEAALICATLAETTYDDAEGFVAATGCEAAIMRAVSEMGATLSAPQGEVERLRARIGTLEDALTKAGEWLDYENSPMGPAETKAYHRLMAQIDAALAQPKGEG